jgi:hypothetical protein
MMFIDYIISSAHVFIATDGDSDMCWTLKAVANEISVTSAASIKVREFQNMNVYRCRCVWVWRVSNWTNGSSTM